MKNKRAKQMIEDVSKIVTLYGVKMVDLPWVPHPLSYMHFDQSNGRDCKIFKKVKKIATPEAWDNIQEILSDVDSSHKLDITFNHSGELQDDHYVDQYESGGFSGDSYAGQIWVPITKKRYFTFHYEC